MKTSLLKIISTLIFLTIISAGKAENIHLASENFGELILTNFSTAPFPHPARAEGHKYKDKFFSAEKNYQDSTVAIFIPKDFKPTEKLDFVIHFHGWGNNVTNALRKYDLIQQFVASGKNAILIVPQGPRDASDSFGGKLEDADGFKKFMNEVLTTLHQKELFKNSAIGKIILSGHSGGYEVISSILAVGGLSDQVKEVWLFDALYGQTEKFQNWFAHEGVRFIDLYTANGGTKTETENLINDLKVKESDFLTAQEATVSQKKLRENRVIFLFSELPHDQVMQAHKTFLKFLQTSSLRDIAIQK